MILIIHTRSGRGLSLRKPPALGTVVEWGRKSLVREVHR